MSRLEVLPLAEWNAFQSLHPAPTFFAAPPWSLAITESFPEFQIYPLKLVLSSEKTVVVPLLRESGGKLRWRVLVGMPFGSYTTIITEDGSPAEQSAIDEAISLIRRCADSMTITLWPLAPQSSLVSKSELHETSVIDVSLGFENAIRSMDGTSRRMAAQADRKGVLCAIENGRMAVETYYDILVQAARKWGLERPTISKELLSAVTRHGGSSVELWLARFEGKAVGGGIVLYGASEAFFWSAATAPDYTVLRANNALGVAIIRSAANRNVKWVNLGASEGLPGVARFKRHLGSMSIPYATISWQRPIYQLVQLIRSKIG